MGRLALAVFVAALACAPLALGAVPLWPASAALVGALALAGVVGVWRAPGLALAVGAAGLTLVAADLASRPFLSRVHVRPEDRYARLWRVDPPVARLDPNVNVQWGTVGDLAALGGAVRQPRAVRFATDDRGFRTDPLGGPAAVVLLGDSFGIGAGTTQSETLASRLTAEHGLTTVNLSMNGMSPYDEAVTLADALGRLDLAPDATLVWLLFSGNDLEGECRDVLPPPPSAWNRMRAWAATVRARSVIGRFWHRLRADPPTPVVARLPDGTALAFHRPYLEMAQVAETEAQALPNVACVRGVMERVEALAEAAGLRLVVAVAPTKVEVYGPYVGLGRPPAGTGAVLRALAAERGLPVLNLRPPLAEAAREGLGAGRLVWWCDDSHWNGAGHAVAARAIAEAIRRE